MIIISWYYCYTLAIKSKKDNKIYPLGPFDNKGEWKYILERSRSFASDLHERCEYRIKPEEISDELIKGFQGIWGFTEEETRKELEKRNNLISYCYLSDLPKDGFIKRGYFLIDEIAQYEKSKVDDSVYFDGFYSYMSEAEYIRRKENELIFGPPKETEDCEGYKYTPHSASEYAYYAYPDYLCEEYESFIIREVYDILDDSYSFEEKDYEPIVILSQG